MNWRDRASWNRAGWVLTALWAIYVVEATRGDSSHPLFRFVFLVPLALWAVLIVARRALLGAEPKTAPPPAKADVRK